MPNERHYSNELNLESVGINLPYNMQAELSVLGAVLLKPETLTDLVEIIRPEMFYTRQNAQIYSEMLRLFTADQTIDFVTLLDAVISDGGFPSALYAEYKKLADAEPDVIFGGRLGEYKYYDMDKVIEVALDVAAKELK